jgi:hypothetical protein
MVPTKDASLAQGFSTFSRYRVAVPLAYLLPGPSVVNEDIIGTLLTMLPTYQLTITNSFTLLSFRLRNQSLTRYLTALFLE